MPDSTSLTCTTQAFGKLSAEILRLGKKVRFQAHGSSMQPLVRDGDILQVQPSDARLIQTGDIILCNAKLERLVVHRVVRKQKRSNGYHFLVQGDQIQRPDGWVGEDEVFGRIVEVERVGVSLDLQRPGMRFLSMLAVMRSRWPIIGRGRLAQLAGRMIRRLPVFTIYFN